MTATMINAEIADPLNARILAVSEDRIAGFAEELTRRAPAASIGPITTEAVTAAGIELKCEAKESTIEGLIDATQLALA